VACRRAGRDAGNACSEERRHRGRCSRWSRAGIWSNGSGLFEREPAAGSKTPTVDTLAAVTGYACIDEPLAVILAARRASAATRRHGGIDPAFDAQNRGLLPARLRGRLGNCLAGGYTDLRKAAYREGRVGMAIADTCAPSALAHAAAAGLPGAAP